MVGFEVFFDDFVWIPIVGSPVILNFVDSDAFKIKLNGFAVFEVDVDDFVGLTIDS